MPTVPTTLRLPGAAERIDPTVHAAMARATSSLSMASALLAAADWALHLAASPGKMADLAALAADDAFQLAAASVGAATDTSAHPPDRRFAAPEWSLWPFNLMHQAFASSERWWDEATHGVWGVEKHHADLVSFGARQWLDMLSPVNQFATNPVALSRTAAQGGANLARGMRNALEDFQQLATGAAPPGTEAFIPGRDVAITPGKVVFRNRLIELMQYAPTTEKVHPEPVLIVPAWIMKYYILDLSPRNSLIRYLVAQGHTVFCISWKNPDADDRDLGMEDYLGLGFHAALAAVNAIVPKRRVHAVGYCLGGTLLAIAAAAMARDGDTRLASLTLLAAQTDFTEPGELGLFIDEGQVSVLEAEMARTGYLSASQMAGAFSMLRSYDLLWSRLVNECLLGERAPMSDLMAWNADATRMPARMHSQYLRGLFLGNDLAEGRYLVAGRPIALSDITLPVFLVGTVTDHVAPWRSVYKLHHELVSDIRYVLTSGGHNAGIVSEPGHPHRSYQMDDRPAGGTAVAPDAWQAAAPTTEGSWWPAWCTWLQTRSGAPARPPSVGAAGKGFPVLGAAPGRYVQEK